MMPRLCASVMARTFFKLDSFYLRVNAYSAVFYVSRVTTSPSSKTSYVVLGSDAGPKKLELIAKHKIKTLTEDEFLELIATRS